MPNFPPVQSCYLQDIALYNPEEGWAEWILATASGSQKKKRKIQGGSVCWTKESDIDEVLHNLKDGQTKDPRYRYLFIHGNSSKYPLSISKAQILLALTHPQAMPDFLGHVFAFFRQELRYLEASFTYEDYLSTGPQTLRIDELGRSGLQIQHCFNLIGLEDRPKFDELNQLLTSETAVYFSFDIVSGNASCVILSPNAAIQERLQKDLQESSRRHEEYDLTTAKGSFSQALKSHLLLFDWCTEKWADYMEMMERNAEEFLDFIRPSPVVSTETSGLRLRQSSSNNIQMPNSRQVMELDDKISPTLDDSTSMDESVRLSRMPLGLTQRIYRYADRCEVVSVAISQDKKVIEDIIARYKDLESSEGFRAKLAMGNLDLEPFYRRAKAVAVDRGRAASAADNISASNSLRTGEYLIQNTANLNRDREKVLRAIETLEEVKAEHAWMETLTHLKWLWLGNMVVGILFVTTEFGFRDLPSSAKKGFGNWGYQASVLGTLFCITLVMSGIVVAVRTLKSRWS
ncbi:hypothetical protein B0I35DRAFT_409938 [Stachybotrys elegans]|uniref:CorA-like transporter domain-containing protein n=1 Tax=Stachybotrys elegans TaxID=80388 RepID=A0A8K0SPW3_9HYPO|nr:hypothetical protein B0I35DRAFT_409938 [Stachybotrys elegans]